MVIMHDRPSPSALAASVPVRLGKSFATKTVAAADQFYAFECELQPPPVRVCACADADSWRRQTRQDPAPPSTI